MLSSKNRAIIASAGSRKTTFLVEKALAIHEKPVLITTYTNENVSQIREYIVQKKGHVPANVEVTSWFGLLLRDGVRPYQNYMTRKPRIDSINFRDTPAPGIGKGDVDRYFLDRGNNVYRDRVADFVCQCDIRSKGLIVRRLENIFGHILIDEFQDFAGYDLEFVERLCTSTIEVLVACDPRQGTYSTHISAKNSRFRRVGILGWLQQKKASGLLVIEERTDCFRSNQAICDFADALFPDFPKTRSRNNEITGHDGVFMVKKNEVLEYVKTHKPLVLRRNVLSDTMNLQAINIGVSKGRTYDRVLIFPTLPMKKYLESGGISAAGDLAKLYVAVTRARYSVAFVV